jgi:hypothetical protein
MKLYPNCSEYVARLTLTKEELKQAYEMAKKFEFSKEDLKLFKKHLKEGKGTEEECGKMFGEFIETEFDQPYIFIRETILEQRKLKNGATKSKRKK